jgi:DNA-directed RNA polymerase subunit RPC12/RpoP
VVEVPREACDDPSCLEHRRPEDDDTVRPKAVLRANAVYLERIDGYLRAIADIEPPSQSDPQLHIHRRRLIKALRVTLKKWADPLLGVSPRSRRPEAEASVHAEQVAARANAARKKREATAGDDSADSPSEVSPSTELLGARIGELLGPATQGLRTELSSVSESTAKLDHEAGKHDGSDAHIEGCALCAAYWAMTDEEQEALERAELAAERKAEREAAKVRAAWIAKNPDAIAWRCADCEAEFTDGDADQGQGPLLECGECESRFTYQAEGSNRCPDCNRFAAKVADLACPECGEGGLEEVNEGDAEAPEAGLR